MTIEHVRTVPVRRPLPRPTGRPEVVGLPRQASRPGLPPTPVTAPTAGPLCLTVPEIGEGDGTVLVRTLRRRESTRAVVLTRRARRREIVLMLGGGIRGAVSSQGVPAVPAGGRVPTPAAAPAPAPAPSPGPDLTARELSVLGLVADGRSNRQIGEHLDLSALTVKSHLARISRKIGTGDRAEMVAYAIRRHLL